MVHTNSSSSYSIYLSRRSIDAYHIICCKQCGIMNAIHLAQKISVAQIRVGHEQSPLAHISHRIRSLVHAPSSSQLVRCLPRFLHRPRCPHLPDLSKTILFFRRAPATVTSDPGEVFALLLWLFSYSRRFFELRDIFIWTLPLHGAALTVTIAVLLVNIEPLVFTSALPSARSLIVHARLPIRIVVMISLIAHLTSTQSHGYSAPHHVGVAVSSSFWHAMMPNLTPDAHAPAAHTTTRACPAFWHSSGNLSRCPYLRRFVLRRQPWVFMLSPVAPYCGFLLSHESYVAPRCSRSARTCRGITTECGGDIGRRASWCIVRNGGGCCRLRGRASGFGHRNGVLLRCWRGGVRRLRALSGICGIRGGILLLLPRITNIGDNLAQWSKIMVAVWTGRCRDRLSVRVLYLLNLLIRS